MARAGVEKRLLYLLGRGDRHVHAPLIHALRLRHDGPAGIDAYQLRELVVDARPRLIRVGMGRKECNAIADQRVHYLALGRIGRHGLHPAQKQRVVDHEHVRAELHRALGHRLGAVQSKGHPLYLRGRIAADKPHGIPLFRQVRRVGLIEYAADIAHAHSGHRGAPLCSFHGIVSTAISYLPHHSTIRAKGFSA